MGLSRPTRSHAYSRIDRKPQTGQCSPFEVADAGDQNAVVVCHLWDVEVFRPVKLDSIHPIVKASSRENQSALNQYAEGRFCPPLPRVIIVQRILGNLATPCEVAIHLNIAMRQRL